MALQLSVLDLSPVSSGSTAAQAIQNTLDLARHAETLGFHRYWLAEHHNMPGIASSSPEILIGQVARETSTIRVGSGGVMLPNHAPLKVAESFLTLEALFPGRIDLGIGRAPGSDQRTALALRRSSGGAGGDDLPAQLAELFAFAGGGFPAGHPYQSVTAVPAGVSLPPVWLLGSSDFSAQVAGALGLGFVFAHHINPYGALEALRLYRAGFTPSEHLSKPNAIVTTSAICADTDEQAADLATSFDLAWLRLYAGRPSTFPSVEEAKAYPYTDAERAQVEMTRARIIVGSPQTVRAKLCALVGQTKTDELMVMTMVHDHAARLHSYELLAEAFELPGQPN
ncbi:MAG: LLM class flavin-dependent oxidoreductase [Janthinobacterium lividum]